MTRRTFRIWGGEGKTGISTRGTALINKLSDGTDLNEVWAEVARVLETYNDQRRSIAELLSFRTVKANDAVPQSIASNSFEEATEVGIPRAIRPPSDVLLLGYSRKDWDIRIGFTWKALREMDSRQVQAHVTQVLEADNKLVNGTVLQRLFSPVQRLNEWQNPTYGLWANDGGMVPPPYLGKTFGADQTHYLTTGTTVLNPRHVEALINHVSEHGYGVNPGTRMVVLLNDDDFISSGFASWRAGIAVRPNEVASYDFIPSSMMPAWISDEQIHGTIPEPEYNGLQVWGTYNNALIIKSRFIPQGWFAAVATSGPNDPLNPIGFREYPDPDWQGLRHIPGAGPYPLVDSYYMRTFGVGTRHRGAAACAQITTNANYTAPIIPT